MRFRVYLLRNRGKKRRWRDVENGSSYVGELLTHYVSSEEHRYQVASLVTPGGGLQKSLVPDLYEPTLVRCSSLAIALRGFERIDDDGGRYAVVQEWWLKEP